MTGGVYQLNRGGPTLSLDSLPLREHGALTTAEALVSAAGIAGTPLPVDW
ncbi:MAG TPA: hypothetical protein VH062_09695 [Polyangiaceae bacterium]|nr:hypothetical protein [Polyangiaceae bacterium]